MTKKPGVKASIVLDRASGAVLKTSGDVSALRTAKSRDAATAASFSNEAPLAEASEAKGVEDFAAMIWNFVNNSGQLVQEVDTDVRNMSVGREGQWLIRTRTSSGCCDYELRNRRLSLSLTRNTSSPWSTIHHPRETAGTHDNDGFDTHSKRTRRPNAVWPSLHTRSRGVAKLWHFDVRTGVTWRTGVPAEAGTASPLQSGIRGLSCEEVIANLRALLGDGL